MTPMWINEGVVVEIMNFRAIQNFYFFYSITTWRKGNVDINPPRWRNFNDW